jgi:hypothetical protein
VSALRFIAWGVVCLDDLSKQDFRDLRDQVRAELRQHGMNLRNNGARTYKVFRRTKKGGHKKRHVICNGGLQQCCQHVMRGLTT